MYVYMWCLLYVYMCICMYAHMYMLYVCIMSRGLLSEA